MRSSRANNSYNPNKHCVMNEIFSVSWNLHVKNPCTNYTSYDILSTSSRISLCRSLMSATPKKTDWSRIITSWHGEGQSQMSSYLVFNKIKKYLISFNTWFNIHKPKRESWLPMLNYISLNCRQNKIMCISMFYVSHHRMLVILSINIYIDVRSNLKLQALSPTHEIQHIANLLKKTQYKFPFNDSFANSFG